MIETTIQPAWRPCGSEPTRPGSLRGFFINMKERTLTDAMLTIYRLASHPEGKLSGSAQRLLAFTLIRVWNECRRPDEFAVYKAAVESTSRLSKDGFLKARNELAEKGYIEFSPGAFLGGPATYRLTFWEHPALLDEEDSLRAKNSPLLRAKNSPHCGLKIARGNEALRAKNSPQPRAKNSPILREEESSITESIKENKRTPISPEGIGEGKSPLKKEKNGFSKSFEAWWKGYPKKVGKLQASKAFDKALKMTDESKLIEAVKRQSNCAQWQKDGGQFIPHPATWLNQGRWEDEVELTEAKYESNEW